MPSDGDRSLELHRAQGDTHNASLLFAWLAKEKIPIAADDFTPPRRTPSMAPLALANNLSDNVLLLKLDVTTLAPCTAGWCPLRSCRRRRAKAHRQAGRTDQFRRG